MDRGTCLKLADAVPLADCREIIGVRIERDLWISGRDVASLAGRPVRLRFQTKEADLFSIRFRD